jgi:hypothetical protein
MAEILKYLPMKCKRILFVGDRGMIKSKQMAQLNDAEFYYLTKPRQRILYASAELTRLGF